MDFTQIFVEIDDFWKNVQIIYDKHLLEDGTRKRSRPCRLSVSEIMTILISFQTSGYRDFKGYYHYLLKNHRPEFPDLVSYDRFITLMPRAVVPLFGYLQLHGLAKPTGISFIDSTCLRVCHNKRITRHRVFEGLAAIVDAFACGRHGACHAAG